MIPSPQPNTFIQDSQEGHFAPSGTLEFDHNEQVDLHKSELASVSDLARVATELADSMHHVGEGEAVDRRRIEFGGGIVASATTESRPLTSTPEIERIDPLALAQVGTFLVALRLAESTGATLPVREK